jgi:hypothetical protein
MRRLASHFPVALGFILLAIVLTWPLAARLSTHLPGAGAGDNLTFVWNLWWMRQALASSAVDFFRTDFLFHPFGTNLTLHTHTALAALIGATVLSGASVIAAQNVLLIASVALNGFSAYLLAHWATSRRRGAAVVAGIYFAAAPYVSAHLQGHFNLVPAWMLPLFAWAWLRSLQPGASMAFAGLAAVALIATAYSDYYYLVYLTAFVLVTLTARWFSVSGAIRTRTASTLADRILVVLIVTLVAGAIVIDATGGGRFVLGSLHVSATSGLNLRTVAWLVFFVWAWRRWRPNLTVRRFVGAVPPGEGSGVPARWSAGVAADLQRVGLVAALFLIGAAPLVIGAGQLWFAGDYATQQYTWRNAPEGIDVVSFVAGNPFHPFMGGIARWIHESAGINTIEGTAWIGLGALLTLYAGTRHWAGQSDTRVWVWTAAMFLVWALGPHLTVLGVRTGLWLPEVLLRYLPIVANARIPGRAMVMVYLAVSVLMALTLARAGIRRPLARVIGVLVVLDFLPLPVPLVAIDRPALYADLAARPAGAVLDLPFGMRDGFGEMGALDHRTLYYQTLHGKPVAGGFVARMAPSLAGRVTASPFMRAVIDLSSGHTLDDAAASAAIADAPHALASRGVRFVVFNVRTASPAMRALVSQMPVRLLSRDGERELYEVEP